MFLLVFLDHEEGTFLGKSKKTVRSILGETQGESSDPSVVTSDDKEVAKIIEDEISSLVSGSWNKEDCIMDLDLEETENLIVTFRERYNGGGKVQVQKRTNDGAEHLLEEKYFDEVFRFGKGDKFVLRVGDMVMEGRRMLPLIDDFVEKPMLYKSSKTDIYFVSAFVAGSLKGAISDVFQKSYCDAERVVSELSIVSSEGDDVEDMSNYLESGFEYAGRTHKIYQLIAHLIQLDTMKDAEDVDDHITYFSEILEENVDTYFKDYLANEYSNPVSSSCWKFVIEYDIGMYGIDVKPLLEYGMEGGGTSHNEGRFTLSDDKILDLKLLVDEGCIS